MWPTLMTPRKGTEARGQGQNPQRSVGICRAKSPNTGSLLGPRPEPLLPCSRPNVTSTALATAQADLGS